MAMANLFRSSQTTENSEVKAEEKSETQETITDDNKQDDGILGVWDRPEVKEEKIVEKSSQTDGAKLFEELMSDVKFSHEEASPDDINAMFDNRDIKGFRSMMDSVGKQAVESTLLKVAPLIQNAMERVERRVLEQVSQNTSANKAVDQMQSVLPVTKDPDIGPVAESILTLQREQGKSVEDSIDMVRRFLAKSSKLTLDDVKDDFSPAATPGTGGRVVRGEDLDLLKELALPTRE